MSEQRSNKKIFKSPFNIPTKHSSVLHETNQEKKVLSPENDQCKDKSSGLSKTKTSNAKNVLKNSSGSKEATQEKKEKKVIAKKLPLTSLTDAEYEEIFSSAIKRILAVEDIPPSDVKHDSGSSDNEDDIENRVAIPEPNEALSPHEEAGKRIEDIPTENDGEQQEFNKKTTNITGIKRNEVNSEVTIVENSSNAKEPHLRNTQKEPKDKQETSAKKPNVPFQPVFAKAKTSDQLQDQTKTNHQEKQEKKKIRHKHKPYCQLSGNTPETKGKDDISRADPSIQKQNYSKSQDSEVKNSSELSQHSILVSQGSSQHGHSCDHVCKKKKKKQHRHGTEPESHSQSSHACLNLSSLSQCSQTYFSQPGADLTLKERLLWLRNRRGVGLWVQCSRPVCNKWRYLPDTQDPVEVPEEWFCHMHPDKKYNSCAAPERPPTAWEEEDLIHNAYTAGSVVWGHLAGYPWWPAMVDDDPDTEQYYWLNGFSDIPTHYNVVFFDEEDITRAWLTPGSMKAFTGRETEKQFRKTVAHGVDYSKRIQAARMQAEEALPMSIRDRLLTFGFLARYKGGIGTLKGRHKHDKKRKHDDEELFSGYIYEDKAGDDEDFNNGERRKRHKRKTTKESRVSKVGTNEIKMQEGNNEHDKVSAEVSDERVSLNKNDGDKFHKYKSSQKPDPLKIYSFDNSIYTQELSNKEPGKPKQKPVFNSKKKPKEPKLNNEEIKKREEKQDNNNNNFPERDTHNVSKKNDDKSSSNNDGKKDTSKEKQDAELNIDINSEKRSEEQNLNSSLKEDSLNKLGTDKQSNSNERNKDASDEGSETQFSFVQYDSEEEVVNCSQDLFLTQRDPAEQIQSQKKNTDNSDSTRAVVGVPTPPKSQGDAQTIAENKKTNEVTGDSHNTGDENCSDNHVRGTDSETNIFQEKENCTQMDVEQVVREANSPTHSVNEQSSSTSNVALVPTVTQTGQNLNYQNSDAVVPQINIDDSCHMSDDSLDFEPEE
ncbi:uncharacterized protein [Periplaneta americana]|uniref:uncharacterized protein n=1 Tax=Periplaneta americana TaxID=6978 RepID=UPI0037E76115